MQTGLLHLHNFLRWAVLITGLIAVVRTLPLLSAGRNAVVAPGQRKSGLFYLIFCDLELVLGLALYFMRGWASQMSAGIDMKNKALRYWGIEHGLTMIIAIILVHVGYSAIKKGSGKRAFWMFLIALVLFIINSPWPFREGIGRGLFPGMSA